MIKEVIMPKLGETMEEGYLASWKKEEGDKVEKGEVLFEVMSDKTNFEVEAIHEGYLRKKLFKPSDDPIKVTSVIGYISDKPDEALPDVSEKKENVKEGEKVLPEDATEVEDKAVFERSGREAGAETERIKASPLARKTAANSNIDISLIPGSGPGGRVEKKDVVEYIENQKSKGGDKAGKFPDEYEIVPWTPLRRIISKRLSESKRNIPHYYLQGKVFVDEIARIKEIRNKENINFTYTDFIVFLTARALQKYPLLNGSLENDEIRIYKSIDIGLAISVKEGLVVPVLRNCGNKEITELSEERKILAAKARDNKLSENEFRGARFVISNLGMYGVENFLPIINPPGLAIMGVGSIRKEPVAVSDRIEIKSVMDISFSFDHRVIDGSYGGLFYAYLKSIIENPSLLSF